MSLADRFGLKVQVKQPTNPYPDGTDVAVMLYPQEQVAKFYASMSRMIDLPSTNDDEVRFKVIMEKLLERVWPSQYVSLDHPNWPGMRRVLVDSADRVILSWFMKGIEERALSPFSEGHLLPNPVSTQADTEMSNTPVFNLSLVNIFPESKPVRAQLADGAKVDLYKKLKLDQNPHNQRYLEDLLVAMQRLHMTHAEAKKAKNKLPQAGQTEDTGVEEKSDEA